MPSFDDFWDWMYLMILLSINSQISSSPILWIANILVILRRVFTGHSFLDWLSRLMSYWQMVCLLSSLKFLEAAIESRLTQVSFLLQMMSGIFSDFKFLLVSTTYLLSSISFSNNLTAFFQKLTEHFLSRLRWAKREIISLSEYASINSLLNYWLSLSLAQTAFQTQNSTSESSILFSLRQEMKQLTGFSAWEKKSGSDLASVSALSRERDMRYSMMVLKVNTLANSITEWGILCGLILLCGFCLQKSRYPTQALGVKCSMLRLLTYSGQYCSRNTRQLFSKQLTWNFLMASFMWLLSFAFSSSLSTYPTFSDNLCRKQMTLKSKLVLPLNQLTNLLVLCSQGTAMFISSRQPEMRIILQICSSSST